MNRAPRAVLIVLLATAPSGGPSAVHAQDAPATPAQPVIPGGVGLVRVDVTVTDHDGRHVGGLRAEDFTIEEDGEPRTIASLRYVTTPARGAAALPATAAPPALSPGEPDTSETAPDVEDAVEARSMIIVIDDLTFSDESRGRVPGMVKHVIELAGPETPLLLMRTGGGRDAMQDFTTDRRRQEAVIAHLRPSPAGPNGLHDDRMERDQRAFTTLQTLRAVQVLVEGLVGRPGRKTLLLVSEGLAVSAKGDEEGVRVLDALRRLTDTANRGGIVICTVDPSGLQTGRLTAEAHFDPDPARDAAAMMALLSAKPALAAARRREVRRGLEQVAAETGGVAVFENNDLKNAAERVWNDQDGYYLIGYEPDPSSVPAPGSAPVEHEISVRVKGRDLTVRSRRVYYARAAAARP